MPKYCIPFEAVATAAVAGTEKTIAEVINANTSGHRCRLLEIAVGPADAAPLDYNLGLSLQRDNAGAAAASGTGTAVTPAPLDNDAVACVQTAKKNLSAEPTYDDELWRIEMNGRSTLVQQWAPEDAPVCQQDQLIGLVAEPRSANAHTISGHIIFENF